MGETGAASSLRAAEVSKSGLKLSLLAIGGMDGGAAIVVVLLVLMWMTTQLSAVDLASRLAVILGAFRRPHLHHWCVLLSTSCHQLISRSIAVENSHSSRLEESYPRVGQLRATIFPPNPGLSRIMAADRTTMIPQAANSNGLPEEVVTCLQNARFVSLRALHLPFPCLQISLHTRCMLRFSSRLDCSKSCTKLAHHYFISPSRLHLAISRSDVPDNGSFILQLVQTTFRTSP